MSVLFSVGSHVTCLTLAATAGCRRVAPPSIVHPLSTPLRQTIVGHFLLSHDTVPRISLPSLIPSSLTDVLCPSLTRFTPPLFAFPLRPPLFVSLPHPLLYDLYALPLALALALPSRPVPPSRQPHRLSHPLAHVVCASFIVLL